MWWLPWSFHLDAPAKGKNWEKPASLWKNDNWLLCFDSSACCCCSLISMFSLFCCAPPDTNENVFWDLNQFWMSDLLHWFIAGAEICFSPVSFLDRVRTSILVAKMLFLKTGCVRILGQNLASPKSWASALQDSPPGTSKWGTCSLLDYAPSSEGQVCRSLNSTCGSSTCNHTAPLESRCFSASQIDCFWGTVRCCMLLCT